MVLVDRLGNMGISSPWKSTDKPETVVLYVCEPMTLEDLIPMTLEDLMPSHVYIYVCVVSLITKLFSVSLSPFAYLSLYTSVN